MATRVADTGAEHEFNTTRARILARARAHSPETQPLTEAWPAQPATHKGRGSCPQEYQAFNTSHDAF